MRSGIYCIENLKNGKKYIGQSTDLEKRKYEHFRTLKGNNHDNGHLQNSYNKYGKKNFKFRVLLYCEPFELTRYEQFFVDFYMPELLYNIRLECVDSNQGITLSEETKKKISESHNGKHLSKETRKKISEASKRENLSKKTIRKMSKAKRGENHPMWEKHHSKEIKEKISNALSGEKGSNSKLTENQVFEILDLYYNKSKIQMDIAKNFPVNYGTISKIVRGKTWKSCYKEFMENNEKF